MKTIKNNKNSLKKIFNLALLGLGLIIWSCSTTDTTGFEAGRVDSIELYQSRVPLLYLGTNASGEPNENLLLSGFVKSPADGRLLNFEVANNDYGVSVDTTSGDLFQYSMLRVSNIDIATASGVDINVVVSAKNGSARANLILSTESVVGTVRSGFTNDIYFFAGLNQRPAPGGGCEIKYGSIATGATGSNFVFSWFARFRPGDGVYYPTRTTITRNEQTITNAMGVITGTNVITTTNMTDTRDINLASVGLNGAGGVRVLLQENPFNSSGVDNSFTSIRTVADNYTIVNSPNNLFPTIFSPWYSALIFTIPGPGDPDFAGTPSDLTNAGNYTNVRRGVPMEFSASSRTREEVSPQAIDYQCNLVDNTEE